MALLLIASWEQTSGKQSNSHIRYEQGLENKGSHSSHSNLVARTDQMKIWSNHLFSGDAPSYTL